MRYNTKKLLVIKINLKVVRYPNKKVTGYIFILI